jgi:glycosyltransferase involved in cell wall biosynthesis
MPVQPLISVCIPCYNGEEFISQTIQSVLAQTFKDFELLLTDDHSNDRTVSIIRSFGDPRINLVQNSHNLGLGANWNKTLSRATGKYVKLLGGDDVLSPECLASQVDALENPANSKVVLAICNRNVIDAGGKIVLRRPFLFRSGRASGSGLIRKSVRWGSNLIGEPVVGLFRRQALNLTGMCDAANPYLIDLQLWADLLKYGDVYVDPDYLVSFRISDTTATSRIGLKQANYFRSFIKGMRRDLAHKVSPLDAALGCGLSYQWCLWRNWFMRNHRAMASTPA